MKKVLFVVIGVVAIGVLFFLFQVIQAGGFVIGGTCGFCGTAPNVQSAEYSCIGKRIEIPPANGCLDCGNTVVCRGIPMLPKSCYTYWGNEKIRLPSCDGPESWSKLGMEQLCASVKDPNTRILCNDYINELQGIGVSQNLPPARTVPVSDWNTFKDAQNKFTFQYPSEVTCASYDPSGKPIYKSCRISVRALTSSTVTVDPLKLSFSEDKKPSNFVSLEKSAKDYAGNDPNYTLSVVAINGIMGILAAPGNGIIGASVYFLDGGDSVMNIAYQGDDPNQDFEKKLSDYDDFKKQQVAMMQKIISTFRFK